MTIEHGVNFRVSYLAWSVPYHPHPRPHQKLTVTMQQATVKHTRTKWKRGTKRIAEYVQFPNLNFRLWSVKYKVRCPIALFLSTNYGMLFLTYARVSWSCGQKFSTITMVKISK